MNERIKEVYTRLYNDKFSCTKENLKELFGVTQKTIENTFKDNDEIIYDKKLKRYRFSKLLPSHIPYKIFYDFFSDSINNKQIKSDLSIITHALTDSEEILMVKTDLLSELSKKIIQFKTAINENCVLKILYKKNGFDQEEKFIKPNTIISNGFTYYLYGTYHEKNGKDVGETRTFELNRVEKIDIENFVDNEVFRKDQFGNAFGPYQKDKYVLLEFDRMSTDFFKKANIFNNPTYEIVDIDIDTLTAKMFYNSLDIEVLKLIQQWMPHIKISNQDKNKDILYSKIKENFYKLIE
ncbi:hypothetical protein CRV00_05595 [Malaciobacter molluscorum]|uniref:WYL domain-containing protein n=1 Tax=Malaciobacter molluscorum TaxID=1032072 RepID=UPI00100B8F68|nr:WYL domain-containing protein [Malaciobacter molluscorum]RXJ94805.1 hypothetical protein CRV00_05595 [Malaciobacter molluscorum]